jgi:hypothetical protein
MAFRDGKLCTTFQLFSARPNILLSSERGTPNKYLNHSSGWHNVFVDLFDFIKVHQPQFRSQVIEVVTSFSNDFIRDEYSTANIHSECQPRLLLHNKFVIHDWHCKLISRSLRYDWRPLFIRKSRHLKLIRTSLSDSETLMQDAEISKMDRR